MIVKVAEALSLKRQFGISGLVTAEEIDSASEAPETAPADKASTQMTSVVQAVPGPVVECPPTAAGSPEPISPDTPAPQSAPPIDSKRMKEEFARMEEQLGNEKFQEILSRQGVRSVQAIRSLLWPDAFTARCWPSSKLSRFGRASSHILHNESDLPVPFLV
jgi:hypothetical protein